MLAKEALKAENINIQDTFSKLEIKLIIKDTINKMWQDTSGREMKTFMKFPNLTSYCLNHCLGAQK